MKPVAILDFPFVKQAFDYDCGAAVVVGVLAYFGIEASEDIIIKKCKTDPETGTKPPDILVVLKEYGLVFQEGTKTIEDIKSHIDKKQPVILLLQAWSDKEINWKESWSNGHYVVAIGYDDINIYFEDPSSVNRDYLSTDELMDRWHDKDSNGKEYIHFGIAIEGNSTYHLEDFVHMD